MSSYINMYPISCFTYFWATTPSLIVLSTKAAKIPNIRSILTKMSSPRYAVISWWFCYSRSCIMFVTPRRCQLIYFFHHVWPWFRYYCRKNNFYAWPTVDYEVWCDNILHLICILLRIISCFLVQRMLVQFSYKNVPTFLPICD